MDGATPNNLTEEDWQQKYRKLAKRLNHFLKRYDEAMGLKQFYQKRAYDLEAELRVVRPEVYRGDQKIDRLEQRIEKLEAENSALRKQLAGVKDRLEVQPRPIPAFVKPNVPKRTKKRPGRKVGHEAAHRPLPEKIDHHLEVPVPRDALGVPSCPHCRTQLSDVQQHDRIV